MQLFENLALVALMLIGSILVALSSEGIVSAQEEYSNGCSWMSPPLCGAGICSVTKKCTSTVEDGNKVCRCLPK